MNLARALGHEVGHCPCRTEHQSCSWLTTTSPLRESLELLIRFEGWLPEIFASAQEFLSRPRVLVPSCLILDVSLPGLNGLDLQKRIASDRIDMPIIFITGHGDIPMSVQAMKAGAVEFLTKPFGDDVLLSAYPKRPSSAARPHLVARRRYGRSGTVTRRSLLANGKSWRW